MTFSAIDGIDSDSIGETVQLRGWLYSREQQDDDHVDVTVRDTTGMLLCRFFANTVGNEDFLRASRTSMNSTVEVTGVVRKDSDTAKGYRLQAKSIEVIDEAEPQLDSDNITAFRRDLQQIMAFPEKYSTVNRVSDSAYHHADNFLTDHDHRFIQYPDRVTENHGGRFIQNATTKNPHLFLEALLPALGSVYTVWQDNGHRFAAQQPWNDFESILDATVELTAYTARNTIRDNEDGLEKLGADPEALRRQVADTTTVSHDAFDTGNPRDASSDHDSLVIVTGADEGIENIHIKHSDTIQTADIHAPGYGRIATCFELATDPAMILERIKNSGRDPDDFQWLNDLRRDGTFTHAGLTLYLDRIVQWLTGLHHEAETRNFPHLEQ